MRQPAPPKPANGAPSFKAPQSGTIAEQLAASDVRNGRRESLACEQCGRELTETKFRDGTIWSPEKTAEYGRKKFGRVLCLGDYRVAKQEAEAQG
jgi:predicted amidophosphoribosyltransferase